MADRRLYSKYPMDEDERAVRTLQRLLPRLARGQRLQQRGRPAATPVGRWDSRLDDTSNGTSNRLVLSSRSTEVYGQAPAAAPAFDLQAARRADEADERRTAEWRRWGEARESQQQVAAVSLVEALMGKVSLAAEDPAKPVRLALVVRSGQLFSAATDWRGVAEELAQLLALDAYQLAYVDLHELDLPAGEHLFGQPEFGGSTARVRQCVRFDILPPQRRSAIGEGLSPSAAATTLASLFADESFPISLCRSLSAYFDLAALLHQPNRGPLEIVLPPGRTDLPRRRREPPKPPPSAQELALAKDHLAAALVLSFEQCVPSAPRWLADAVRRLAASSSSFELDGAPLAAPRQGGAAARLPAAPAASDAATDGDAAPAECNTREVLPAAFWRALAAAGRGKLEHLCLRGFGQLAGAPPPLLPTPLGALRHLSHLDLSDMRLSALPQGLSRCRSLTVLKASRNLLAEMPEELWALPHLVVLDLAHNQLRALALPPPPDADGQSAPPAGRRGSAGGRGAAKLQLLDLSHNKLGSLPHGLGEALAALRELNLESNLLAALPGSLVELQTKELRALHLDGNPAAPDELLLSAHVAAGTYLAVEMCTAPRPTATLKGDAARYLAALSELHFAVTLAFGGSVPLVANTEPAETSEAAASASAASAAAERAAMEGRGRGRRPASAGRPAWGGAGRGRGAAGAAARFPRLGAFEVVVRTASGLRCVLFSKLEKKTFPLLAETMGALFYFLGARREWTPRSVSEGRQRFHQTIAAGDATALQRYLFAAPYLALDRDARGRSMAQLAELHARPQCASLLRRGAPEPLLTRAHEPPPRFAPLQPGVAVEPLAGSHAQLSGLAGARQYAQQPSWAAAPAHEERYGDGGSPARESSYFDGAAAAHSYDRPPTQPSFGDGGSLVHSYDPPHGRSNEPAVRGCDLGPPHSNYGYDARDRREPTPSSYDYTHEREPTPSSYDYGARDKRVAAKPTPSSYDYTREREPTPSSYDYDARDQRVAAKPTPSSYDYTREREPTPSSYDYDARDTRVAAKPTPGSYGYTTREREPTPSSYDHDARDKRVAAKPTPGSYDYTTREREPTPSNYDYDARDTRVAAKPTPGSYGYTREREPTPSNYDYNVRNREPPPSSYGYDVRDDRHRKAPTPPNHDTRSYAPSTSRGLRPEVSDGEGD